MKTAVHTFLLFFALFLSASAHAEMILQIGDSQSYGTFGAFLHRHISVRTPYAFKIAARSGSTAGQWLDYSQATGKIKIYPTHGIVHSISPQEMPPLKKWLHDNHPRTVIVQLGGNMVTQDHSRIRKDVRKLLTLVKQHTPQCIWIGPPNGRERPEPQFSRFYPVLKAAVEREGCKFVDSREYTTYPATGGDGIHFHHLGFTGLKIVSHWARMVFDETQDYL